MSKRNFMLLNPTPRDAEYVDAYKRFNSQIKAGEFCGVSRETIARACRRAGVRMDGVKNNGKIQPQAKITDAELQSEIKQGASMAEVAKKHSMSFERVYQRARRLGLQADGCDWRGGHYYRRLKFYGNAAYDKTVTLKAVIERDRGVCQICGGRVNTEDKINGHIGRLYPTIDHIVPLSKGGAHTWDNVQLAHLCCNAGKKDSLNSGRCSK